MKDVLWLVKKIAMVTFRKKRNIIIYFCLPLVGIFISFLVYGGSEQSQLKVAVVNQDHQKIANDTVHFLESLNNVKVMKLSEAAASDGITSGTIDCMITFKSGFSQSILSGQPGYIEITSIKGSQITGFVHSYLYQYIDNILSISKAANGNLDTFNKMYANYQNSHYSVKVSSLSDTSLGKDMTNQTIGFLLMIMLISAGNFAEIIIKEKENRTYFRLLSTPINARKYVLSNIIVSILVMFVQIIFTLIFLTKIFHINMHVTFWQMTEVLLIYALISVGLSLTIVSFSNSSASAGALQNLVSTPTCLLAGCFWPVGIMPKAVQRVADFMPQHWVLDTVGKLQQGDSVGSLYLNIMVLFAFAVAFFLIAVYKFSINKNVRNFI
ncbi:ABC transporter permease [Bacillus sp. BRMEA1]|uniref:ABC transporter permease n=1 Tax=Neobacillus endophyticus TaxID=2738405 RepID=UPI001563DD01|nr:ABC transporter permease [Neobacillus endophyticus]NRD78696.1 ABC transporter permease [Neobacillus endophyticus]